MATPPEVYKSTVMGIIIGTRCQVNWKRLRDVVFALNGREGAGFSKIL
jgi:hypothetical protein